MSTIQPPRRTFVGWLLPAGAMPFLGTCQGATYRRIGFAGMMMALVLLSAGESMQAQPPVDEPSSGAVKRTSQEDRSFEAVKIASSPMAVDLTERFSKDLEFSEKITKVDGHDPDVITVVALDPSRLRIRGLAQGVTTMVVTGASSQRYVVEVFVSGDARLLQSVLKRAFPDSAITCRALKDDSIMLTGYVTDNQTITQIMDVARVYAGNIINHIRVGGPQEVQLRVKILEVQRSKLRTFGIDFQAVTKSAVLASSPGSIAPISAFTNGLGAVPSATMAPSGGNPTNLLLGFNGNQFAFDLLVQALKTEGLLKVLSEPVLVARSGEAARLSDGGEFPIPVPGGLGTVTIEFREFGVILQALPIVISPTRLKQQVTAEVSDKDTANSVTLLGTTVPGLSKRKVETTVDMNFGETMVIGGLISTRVSATYLKAPVIGEFPLIGAMFSKKTFQQSETELIIMITPEFGSSLPSNQIPPGGPGTFTTTPTDREMYRDGLIEVPKYGPDCGPDCPPNFSNRYQGDCNPPGAGFPGTPMITPGPSGPHHSGGLIMPQGAGSPTAIPPAPTSDPSVSRKTFGGSSWPSKSRANSSTKSKDTGPAAEPSAIQPAGFRKQPKSTVTSDGEFKEKKTEERE